MTSLRIHCSGKKVNLYCSLLQCLFIIHLKWFVSEVIDHASHTAELRYKYFTVLLFPCFVKAVCQLHGYRALNKKCLIVNVELACLS